MRTLTVSCMMCAGVSLAGSSSAFVVGTLVRNARGALHNNKKVPLMGLYDEPLPPRPRKQNTNENENDSVDDEESIPSSSIRLFEMQPDGTEKNGYLPQLSRSLESGVDCYFEQTDRKVQTLVVKTNCHVKDAAWALEACKGDVTEAWTCISTAQRLTLNQKVEEEEEEIDWDAEFKNVVYNPETMRPADKKKVEKQETVEEQRERRIVEERKRNFREFFSGGTPNEPWLPKENPKPIDDEPWFTG